jgi:hypothetical protein
MDRKRLSIIRYFYSVKSISYIPDDVRSNYLPFATELANLKAQLLEETVGDMGHVVQLIEGQIELATEEIIEVVNNKFNNDLVKSLNDIAGAVTLTTDNSLVIENPVGKILRLGMAYTPVQSLNSVHGIATLTSDSNITVANDTTNKNIHLSLNITPVLTLNGYHGNINITSPGSSISVDDSSSANTVKLTTAISRVSSLNGQTGIVNLTSDGSVNIDATTPNVIRLTTSGGGGGGGDPFDGILNSNLVIGNDTTTYVINLNDAVMSSASGILVLENTNITLNGHTTLNGDTIISLGKKVFGINSAT